MLNLCFKLVNCLGNQCPCQVFSFKLDDTEYRTYIGSQEVELDVPEDYDPRAQQIAALEAKRTKAMADYQKSVTEINDHISKLQAIEYTA